MKQIRVELHMIGTDSHLDFLLPLDRPLADFLEELAVQAESMDPCLSLNREQPWLLCDLKRHLLLDPQRTLAELGVCNGARLSLC